MMQLFNHLYSSMPWALIDCVVFDVGNVLLQFEPTEIMKTILPGEERVYPQIMECVFKSPYWLMRDRGTISKEQAIEWMVHHGEEAVRSAIERIMTGWEHLESPVEEGVRALKTCKRRGKQILLLTNYAKEPFQVVRCMHSFFDLADGIVCSGREGLIKPDPAIYQRMIRRYHLQPARTLFIDDAPANVESALNVGLQAIYYNQPGLLDAFITD